MFTADYASIERRRKPRQRYWWAALCFAAGVWAGAGIGHLF